ncbi:OLC1v1020488C1 [Oldenlandia corymbosa var. corymbosa]|uniref:OLC1v1020488C1 n=1 Tax=Oldenlandia corymbosa var. corymbosa TaxID=529605 RepID=A0AAV1EH44_OLDCO|nr:OLC1v1020488C1 [Oldenlandia corymbosa var. corymbosa]
MAGREAVTVLMVPLPAQGHLNPLLHLARLIASYNIPVHYVSTPPHIRQAKLRVHGWDPDSSSNLHFHGFPVPPHETPPPDPTASIKFPTHLVPAVLAASAHLREPVSQLMKTLSDTTQRLVVIHDSLIAYVIQDIGLIPNAESYCFSVYSAFFTYSFAWGLGGKPEGVPELQLLKTLPNLSFPQDFLKFMLLQLGTKITSSGTLLNSCAAIDGPFLDYRCKFKSFGSEKFWAVGPLHPVRHDEADQGGPRGRHYCLDWLDKQAPNSVLFVAFGSSITFSDEEIKEMAIGLEKSEQKFVWVLRDADKGDLFKDDAGGGDQVKQEVRQVQWLEGFESRIKETNKGIIVRDWAPQLEILSHSSTGGFLSPCGWNSCMETLSHGVPVIAWPMHTEQPINAVLLTKVLKVGLPILPEFSSSDPQNEETQIKSKDIENAVRTLMDSEEGDQMRQRAQQVSTALKASLMDNGTPLGVDSFVSHIRR